MFIDNLRNSILQRAIQGKLTEQLNTDGNVDIILEKIRKERFELEKKGEIRKLGKPNKLSNVKIEIPNNRRFEKLGNLLCKRVDNRGKTPEHTKIKDDVHNIDLLEINSLDVNLGIIHSNVEKFISEDIYSSLRGFIEKDDILLATVGSIGKFALMDDSKSAIAQNIIAIRCFSDISQRYIFYVLQSPYVYQSMGSIKMEAAQPSIKVPDLMNVDIPLPPLEEQKRIVAKLDELLPLLDEARPLEEEITKLEKDFPTKLRQSILQYAIQGKLVEQNSEDEPASELLKKIKEEKEKLVKEGKIKKEKPLEPITDEEKLFDIPDNWEWVRLGEISKKIFAGGDKPEIFSKEPIDELNVPVIANGETNDGLYGYTNTATVNTKSLTVSGRGTIGFSVIRDYPYTPIVRLIVIEGLENIVLEYIKLVIQASLVKGNGSAIPQLTVPMISPLLIPLPPLEEQKRIVAKLDELMKLCDELEEQIG